MSSVESQEVTNVWQRVTAWPDQMKWDLASRLLKSISAKTSGPADAMKRGPAVDEMVGLATTSESPPDDAQVRDWLAEHRLEKYGR